MALLFDAANERVEIAASASINDTTALTAVAWVYTGNTAASVFSQNIYRKNSNSGEATELIITGSGIFGGAWGDGYFGTTTTNRAVPNNSWVFLAAVFSVGAAPRGYIGTLTQVAIEASYEYAGNPSVDADDTGNDLFVGNSPDDLTTHFLTGRIAMLAWYESSLTTAQIVRLQYAPHLWSADAILFHHYGFNGTSTQPDWSGNGNAGTVTGATVGDHVPLGPMLAWPAGLPYVVAAGAVALTVQDATHSHAVDNAALTQHNVLAAQDAAHGHGADNAALTQHYALVVADATHAHAVDNVALVQHHALTVADALHAHAVDSATLTQHNVLAVQDASHGHTVDSVVLTQHYVIAVADAAHSHTVDSVVLTQHYILTVADTLHAHTVDNVTLAIAGQLTVQDATHAHSADSVALTQHHVLVVADALHGHTVDALLLAVQLVVQDALHAHSVDSVVLGTSLQLVVQDALHGHAADSMALTQHHALTVADALHSHTAGNVVLDIGAAFVVTAIVAMRFVAQGNVDMRFTAQEDIEL